MKQKIKAILDDDRGVSPVIGVILMVAITVILAAVIGTFVLGLGDSLQQAPQSTLSVEDAPEGYNNVAGELNDSFEISQNGGDTLTMGDLRIVVSDVDGSNSATFESGSWTAGDGAGSTENVVAVQKGGSNVSDTTELTVGEELTITQTLSGESSQVFTTGEYEIEIIHVPSDSIIKSTTVNLS